MSKQSPSLYLKILMGLASFNIFVSASAYQFNIKDEAEATLDTTISYGTMWRVQSAQPDLLADINRDDGNNNFNTGLVSNTPKVTSELEITRQDYGLFTRATAFYDTVIKDHHNAGGGPTENNGYGNNFPDVVEDVAGSDARFLDAYVWKDFTWQSRPWNVRLGEQVVNWGEGVFLVDGVNTANPLDVSKLNLPGSEIEEVLQPLPMLYLQGSVSDQLSVEAFYQMRWEETELDPVDTYFSTTDNFGDGADTILVDLNGTAVQALAQALNGTAVSRMARTEDNDARHDGQYGVSFRYFAENLNNTEFGFYFVNYHSHVPYFAMTTGNANTFTGVSALEIAAATAACAPLPAAVCLPAVTQGLNAVALLDSSTYRAEYPDDIHMYGMSFNTLIDKTALVGELAYRPNLPIVNDAGNFVVAEVATNSAVIGGGGTSNIGVHQGTVGANELIRPYERRPVINGSVALTHSFGRWEEIDNIAGLIELGFTHVNGVDVHELWNRDNADDGDAAMDKTAWGYRSVVTTEFNDVWAGIDLQPSLTFNQDVNGNSYAGGSFIDGRKSAKLGVAALYLNNFETSMAYTEYWGADSKNLIRDRDNITFNVKYSF